MSEDQLFTFGTDSSHDRMATIYTGHSADGRQLLAGWGRPDCGMVFLWFDEEGRLLQVEPVILAEAEREWEDSHARPDYSYLREIDRLNGAYLSYLRARETEAGTFRPGPIQVRHFYTDEPFPITIRVLPNAALEVLALQRGFGECR